MLRDTDMDEIHKIKKQLSKVLDDKRYEHTLGVAYTEAALAMRHGSDIKKAEIAGLLHDCAKCMENEKKLSICEKHNIEITDAEKKNLFLLHAKVGAYVAQKKYHIDDPDVLNAIKYHTTGRPKMSLLEKIVYIADYIEPGRSHASNLDEIRRLSFQNLDEALLVILNDTLQHLMKTKKEIDPMTKQSYDYYRNYESSLSIPK